MLAAGSKLRRKFCWFHRAAVIAMSANSLVEGLNMLRMNTTASDGDLESQIQADSCMRDV